MSKRKKKTKVSDVVITSEQATAAIHRANIKLKHQYIERKLKLIQNHLLDVGVKSSVHLTMLGRVVIKTNIFSDPSEFYFVDVSKPPQK